jgi:hypothetical protein
MQVPLPLGGETWPGGAMQFPAIPTPVVAELEEGVLELEDVLLPPPFPLQTGVPPVVVTSPAHFST